MTKEQWANDCMYYGGKVLSGEYGHYCPDWDGLPIDETVPEYDACTCDKEAIKASGEAGS